jgi:hypothetical protein
MKAVALLFLLGGSGNFGFLFAPAARTVGPAFIALTLLSGLLLVGLATGIWMRRAFAWPLGFAAIVAGGFSFMLMPQPFSQPSHGRHDGLGLLLSSISGLCISTALISVWYRQRGYFHAAAAKPEASRAPILLS